MTPSATRVARAWNNDLMLRQVGEFRDHLQRFNTAVQTRDRLVAYRWLDVIRVGKNLADWAVETRSIPKGREKAAELAFRLFLAAARAPRDVFAWAEKNQRHLAVFQEALGWPEKSGAAEGSEETFPLAGFTVHNTLNLSGSELGTTRDVVEQGAKTLRASGIPKGASILYGNLFIVGRLKQADTLAWYNSATDEMYLRPFPRVGRGEIHNLIHELGHRYWYKVLPKEAQSKWATYHMLIGIRPPTDVKMPQPGEEFPVPIKGRKSPPVVEKIEGDAIFFVGGGSVSRRKTFQILQQKAAYPTDYASTSYSEHFAEAFAMYCLGTLKPEHVRAFEAIIIRGEAYDPRAISASRVAARWLAGGNPGLSDIIRTASTETLQERVSGYFREVGKHLASLYGGKSRLNDKSDPMVRYIVDWNTPESPDLFSHTVVFTLERGILAYSVYHHDVVEGRAQKPRLVGKQTTSADTTATAMAELVTRVDSDEL